MRIMKRDIPVSERFLSKPTVAISEITIGGKYDLPFKVKNRHGEFILIHGGVRGEILDRFHLPNGEYSLGFVNAKEMEWELGIILDQVIQGLLI